MYKYNLEFYFLCNWGGRFITCFIKKGFISVNDFVTRYFDNSAPFIKLGNEFGECLHT